MPATDLFGCIANTGWKHKLPLSKFTTHGKDVDTGIEHTHQTTRKKYDRGFGMWPQQWVLEGMSD